MTEVEENEYSLMWNIIHHAKFVAKQARDLQDKIDRLEKLTKKKMKEVEE